MKTLVRFELFKQLRRKENLLVFFMFLLPLFYGLGVHNHSLIVTYNSKELINGLTFADNMYALVYMVFVIFLILAINSANILKAVSYTHLTLPTIRHRCRSRWSPYH